MARATGAKLGGTTTTSLATGRDSNSTTTTVTGRVTTTSKEVKVTTRTQASRKALERGTGATSKVAKETTKVARPRAIRPLELRDPGNHSKAMARETLGRARTSTTTTSATSVGQAVTLLRTVSNGKWHKETRWTSASLNFNLTTTPLSTLCGTTQAETTGTSTRTMTMTTRLSTR